MDPVNVEQNNRFLNLKTGEIVDFDLNLINIYLIKVNKKMNKLFIENKADSLLPV